MNTVEISGDESQKSESPVQATWPDESTMRMTALPQANAVEVIESNDTVATSPLQDTESAGFAEGPQMAVRSNVREALPPWRSVQPFLSVTVTVRLAESTPLLTTDGFESVAELTCGKTSTFTVAVYELDPIHSTPHTAVTSKVGCGYDLGMVKSALDIQNAYEFWTVAEIVPVADAGGLNPEVG